MKKICERLKRQWREWNDHKWRSEYMLETWELQINMVGDKRWRSQKKKNKNNPKTNWPLYHLAFDSRSDYPTMLLNLWRSGQFIVYFVDYVII